MLDVVLVLLVILAIGALKTLITIVSCIAVVLRCVCLVCLALQKNPACNFAGGNPVDLTGGIVGAGRSNPTNMGDIPPPGCKSKALLGLFYFGLPRSFSAHFLKNVVGEIPDLFPMGEPGVRPVASPLTVRRASLASLNARALAAPGTAGASLLAGDVEQNPGPATLERTLEVIPPGLVRRSSRFALNRALPWERQAPFAAWSKASGSVVGFRRALVWRRSCVVSPTDFPPRTRRPGARPR